MTDFPPPPPLPVPGEDSGTTYGSATFVYDAKDIGPEKVNIQGAVKRFFDNYANFRGRASRSEYWYMQLVSVFISLIDSAINSATFTNLLGVAYLAVIIPSLAVGVRRLHDVGKSAWSLLWVLLPIVGWIILLVAYVTESKAEDNVYGPGPR